MIFRQILNEPIAAAAYLVGCAATGEAALVDPSLSAEQYLLLAADRGLRIVAVFETHLHADYFSTGRAVAALSGAALYLPQAAAATFPHQPLADGETVSIGRIVITALHTPGHTPEHTTYLVADTPRAERPWFALTGDCLFVGDVGRVDLVDLPGAGPDQLFASIFERLLVLPDDVEIFPGHFGGSACGGKAMSGKVSSTIGFERRFNLALQLSDRAAFAAQLAHTPRAAVEAVVRHRHTNQGLLPLPADYGLPIAAASVPALSVEAFFAALATGCVPLDLRPRDYFAAAHLPGALSAPYSRSALADRAAALLPPGTPLVVLAENAVVAAAAAELLSALGRNPVHGFLNARPEALAATGVEQRPLQLLGVDALAQRLGSGSPVVLDVRDAYEWEKGVIDGALLISHGALREALTTLPRTHPIVTICESGTRATLAASLLLRHGFADVSVVAPEGMSDYAARYPTVAPAQLQAQIAP